MGEPGSFGSGEIHVNLIYQYWIGDMRSGVYASMDNMQQYAKRIGAAYRFDKDPNIASKLVDVPLYYEDMNPILDDSFLKYDKVLVVDMDVFAIDGLIKSIFDLPITDVGICTEPQQPEMRARLSGHICGAKDEIWARAIKDKYGIDAPRNEAGLLKVYNTGVLVFSKAGMQKARQRFAPFQEYVDTVRKAGLSKFYTIDQNYFHAMMVKHLDYTELDNGWNSYVHYVGSASDKPRPINDSRNESTKFVHIQLRGADDFDADKLWRITNRPQNEWKI